MGTRKGFMFNTHWDFGDKGGVVNEFCKTMVFFFSSFWVFFTTCVLYLFRFLTRYLCRFQVDDSFRKFTPKVPAVVPEDDNQTALEPKAEPDVIEFEDSEYDGFGEKETPQLSFKFQFQAYDDGGRSNAESSLDVSPKKEPASSASKYQFLPSKDFSGFVEEPQVVSFTIFDDGLLSVKDMVQQNSVNETIHEDTLDDSCSVEEPEKPDSIVLDEFLLSEKDQLVNFEQNSPSKEDFSDEIQLLSEKEFLGFDSDLESESFADRFSTMNNVMGSSSDAFMSDEDFESEAEPENIMEHDEGKTKSVGAFQYSEEVHVEIVVEPENPINSVEENTEPVAGFQNSEEIHVESEAEPKKGMESVEVKIEPMGGFQNSEEVHVESEAQLLSEKEFLGFDSDLESESFADLFSTMNNVMDSSSDAFMSDEDFESEAEPENIMEHDEGKTKSVGAFQYSEEVHVEIVVEPENPIKSVEENTEPVAGFQNSEEIHVESEAEPKKGMESVEVKIEPMGGFQNSEEVHVESEAEPKNTIESIEEKTESVGGSEVNHVENPRILEPAGYIGTTDPISQVDNLMGLYEDMFESVDDIEIYLEPHFQKPSDFKTEAQLEREYAEMKAECEREDSGVEDDGMKHGSVKIEEPSAESSSYGSVKTEEPSAKSSLYSDSEDYDQLETLWEHQNLIEQLKMELKKAKATGLPTILEESESPRMSEDLKPWKFDDKFLHEDRMDELHKFYKSYRERMRKFDILNYQKMYAMGFLQLNDPLQSIPSRKSSTPTLTSILSQSFRLSKRRRPEEDSTVKFIRELQSDLEVVYVGQVCLSWEFLHWEYGKARELLESDPYETRQYNQVAGELQQFQVLMQRFLENELFQGPRVQNYIKSRCILRNLLQVPVIKEDPKDKEGRKRRKDAITCSMVLEIIEETMRIFWDFIRADKDESNAILKGFLRPQVELSDPADSELLMDVQTNLQKKEKKIKDIVRSGNCIVRRFQKHHEEGRPDQLVFFSQIDLKLVSRVLKMSRITTDQLVWCQKKLSKINIVHRKVHVEPTFLLFPC